jgi:hypothetical protein
VANPDGTLVEICQQPRKHQRRLLILGLAPFGPSDEYQPAIARLTGPIGFCDVLHDDIGLRVGLHVRHTSPIARRTQASERIGAAEKHELHRHANRTARQLM